MSYHRYFRIYYKRLGGHFHCRVFCGNGKSGDLVFQEQEWTNVYNELSRIALVVPEDGHNDAGEAI